MNCKSFIPLSALLICSLLAPFTYTKSHKAKDSTTVTIPIEKRNVPASVKSQVYKQNAISLFRERRIVPSACFLDLQSRTPWAGRRSIFWTRRAATLIVAMENSLTR